MIFTLGGVRHPFCAGNGNIIDWIGQDGKIIAHHEDDPCGNERIGNLPSSYGFFSNPCDATLICIITVTDFVCQRNIGNVT